MANRNADTDLRQVRRLVALERAGQLSDGQLLERYCVHNDEAAFEMLVRQHGPLVLGVCRRALGHEQDAEDVFQATFLLLARKANTIRKQSSVGSWLFGAAYRLALKAKAAAMRQRRLERQEAPCDRQA